MNNNNGEDEMDKDKTNDGARVLRNCWTCRYDSVEESSGCHLCHAFAADGVVDWVDEHVANTGGIASMPPKTADNCPGWKPKGQDESDAAAPEKRPRKRRTCETAGCSRVSGDARFCRTCRAEAPVRAELARKARAHRDEVQAYRTERGEIVRFLASAGITGASPVHAAKVAAGRIQRDAELRRLAAADAVHDKSRLGTQTARANRMERDAADALGRLQAAHAERDELTAALQVARDHERGQAERLRRAKAERDSRAECINQDEANALGLLLHCEPVGGSITRAVAAMRDDRDDLFQHRDNLILSNIARDGEIERLTAQRDTALGNAKTEARALRLRLRIMYAVAGLLAVAAVVGGVL